MPHPHAFPVFLSAAAVALLAGVPARAADTAAAAPSHERRLSPADYREVDLRTLVPAARTGGQRVIFAPTPVRFRARLAALPAPQKADYLMGALALMRVDNPPNVGQRIGLDYGGEKGLAAYVEDGVARRIASQVKLGESRSYSALHVYNDSKGPALLITGFDD